MNSFYKIIIFAALAIFLFSSCGANSELDSLLQGATEMRVIYYGKNPARQENNVVYSTTDQSSILKLAEYISSSEAPEYKCGYDGQIMVITKTGMVDIEFNLTEACRHVAFMYDRRLYSRKLTDEGYNFLKGLINK